MSQDPETVSPHTNSKCAYFVQQTLRLEGTRSNTTTETWLHEPFDLNSKIARRKSRMMLVR